LVLKFYIYTYAHDVVKVQTIPN